MDYHNFNRLLKARIETPLTKQTTSSFKYYPPVDKFKILIKWYPTTTGFKKEKPFFYDTENIILVTPEEFFSHLDQVIMTDKGRGRKGGIEIYMSSPGYYLNAMVELYVEYVPSM